MVYAYTPKGVCSTRFQIEIDDEGLISNLIIEDGCDGNGKGIGRLIEGRPADEIIQRLEGIRCGRKKTSCPDQLAQMLKAIKEER